MEHKGDLPDELLNVAKDTLFGCDVCTGVCPWNLFGNDKVMPELQSRSMPTAVELLAMSKPEFKVRFKHTPVYRTGLERLKRNAARTLPAFSS